MCGDKKCTITQNNEKEFRLSKSSNSSMTEKFGKVSRAIMSDLKRKTKPWFNGDKCRLSTSRLKYWVPEILHVSEFLDREIFTQTLLFEHP